MNSDLIESIYPVFSNFDKNENEFKKMPFLIKPLNEDYNGFYKCRIILKSIDDMIDNYHTEEVYLKAIKTKSLS